MVLSSDIRYPKKRYKLKIPKEEIYSKLIEEKDRLMAMKSKEYDFTIYTDGGYNVDFRVGSWSYLIKAKCNKKHFKFHKGGGSVSSKYNNPIIMELKAVIEAIDYIANEKNVERLGYIIKSITVYSDSRQIINSRTQYQKYKENDFKLLRTNNEMFGLLKESWDRINEINESFDINYKWVRAHNGNTFNEYCDKACKSRIKEKIIEKKIFAYNNKKL